MKAFAVGSGMTALWRWVSLISALWAWGCGIGFASESLSGTWTSRTPAPTKRTEVAVAALHGHIYVIGGFSEPSLENIANFSISSAVEVYDPATDTWSSTTPLPEGRHHAGIATYQGRLYVVGGFTSSFLSVWHPVSTVYCFDPSTKAWSELPPMPTERGALGVAVHDGRLYAIGGFDGEKNPAVVEVFDLETQRWSTVAPLPTPRDHLAVVTVGSRIYAIGGRPNLNYHRNMATVEAFDPAANRWESRASLPTARSGIAAGLIDGWIYVLGGESENGTFATNEAYDPRTNRWRTMAPMPTARHGLGAAVVNGRLYAIAGGTTPGASFSNVNEMFTPPSRREARSPRATPERVGAIMALLATLDDARVLPPEGSAQADQVIHALIQVQSAVINSSDPAFEHFVRSALASQLNEPADSVYAQIRQSGLTAQALGALIAYGARRSIWDDPAIVSVFESFHVTRDDWQLLENLVLEAERRFDARGTSLQEVYDQRRRTMPGAHRAQPRKPTGN